MAFTCTPNHNQGNNLRLGIEGVFGAILLRQDFIDLRFDVDGTFEGQLGGFVVVLVDFLVVLGSRVNEHATDTDQFISSALGDDSLGNTIGDRFRHSCLGRAKHLHDLIHVLDRDFGDHDRCRLADQIRGQHCQQVRVAVRLIAQSVGKGRSDGTILEPRSKSICATSFPSPHNASPMYMDMVLTPEKC